MSLSRQIFDKENDKKMMLKNISDLENRFNSLFKAGIDKNDMNRMLQASGIKRKMDELKDTVNKVDEAIEELKRQKVQ